MRAIMENFERRFGHPKLYEDIVLNVKDFQTATQKVAGDNHQGRIVRPSPERQVRSAGGSQTSDSGGSERSVSVYHYGVSGRGRRLVSTNRGG